MTFPDPRLERSFDVAAEGTRPLTEGERKAADRDTVVGERIYAPASERVPREPAPGHGDYVEHPDARTPERQAAVQVEAMENEPSFTRIARPSPVHNGDSANHTANGMSSPTLQNPRNVAVGLGVSWFTVACCGIGVWLVMRWQRERNKPINRLRRQAARAAHELRNRAPTPREAARPAMGLSTALLSLAILLWQQSQQRSHRASKQMSKQGKQMMTKRAARAVAETDWQKRLMHLKDRWNPARLELEKMQISRR